MSEIKVTIETLAKEWGWDAVSRHTLRKTLLSSKYEGRLGGLQVMVSAGNGFVKEFTFRHEKKNGDFRIWTRSPGGLIQWRTDPTKGDRLIYRPFGTNRLTERVSLEDIFMDPTNVDDGEVEMFKMLYGELVPLIPLFHLAIQHADQMLIYLNNTKAER